MELSYELYAILFTVALLTGFFDSISGGGGLIIVPTLILCGFLPTQAIATNKLQGIFGKLSAVVYYRRQGVLNIPAMRLPLIAAFAGAAVGALVVQQIHSEVLTKHIPWLIGAVALYFLLVPGIGDLDKKQRIQISSFAWFIATLLGFYDGFFGPASGSLFALGFVALLGYSLPKATAYTRLLLLASNTASLIVFIGGGNVVWRAGLCMAAGQWIGARYGSQAVMLKGSRLVKPMLVTICLLLVFRMVFFQ